MIRNLYCLFNSCGQLIILRGRPVRPHSQPLFVCDVQLGARFYSTRLYLTNMSQENSRSGCIFCKICDDSSKQGLEKLLYSDDEIVVFRDIYPAAKHHYLIVSREHIPNPKNLTIDQKPLVEQMILIAKQTLETEGAAMSDARLGFHWPPFNSIKHLHLHAISPTNGMSFVQRLIFRENSWWFVSPDYVLNRLKSGSS